MFTYDLVPNDKIILVVNFDIIFKELRMEMGGYWYNFTALFLLLFETKESHYANHSCID